MVLYLRQEGRGIGLLNKLRAYQLQDEGLDTVEANHQLGFPADARDYRVAAEMLKDLGIERVSLLTNNPAKIDGLERHGVTVEERVPLNVEPGPANTRYLLTKQALILPPGAVGLPLGGEIITSQLPSGVVFVDASTNPVLVRANFDEARSYGFEHELELQITRSLQLRTVSTFARIESTDTGEPSNISGGSPAADVYLFLPLASCRQVIFSRRLQGTLQTTCIFERSRLARSFSSMLGSF